MTSWLVLITALVACIGAIGHLALQYVVVIWSLKADKGGRQYAIELLKVLQNGRDAAADRSRARRKVPRLNDASRGTDRDDCP